MDSESALRSAGTLLRRVRAPRPASWSDGEPQRLRSLYCGLAMCRKQLLIPLSLINFPGYSEGSNCEVNFPNRRVDTAHYSLLCKIPCRILEQGDKHQLLESNIARGGVSIRPIAHNSARFLVAYWNRETSISY
ncbi:hypothetical protein PoB_001256700 [Plakobranchus ocellatus]|uniref:Uncharacterized protein n=1 Tax=Plakobranchus ocellatus TaxID=259542 RepID=A0AAV3YV91_9GAST|nr:hypothetical protein PoB_001256700 [Plakobranchus ocellatus]